MNQLASFLDSGILELYVMGTTSSEEKQEVDEMAAKYPEVRQEIDRIAHALETYALAHAVKPKATLKTEVLAAVDYLERMKNGEPFAMPPRLTAISTISDFEPWLLRPDMSPPPEIEGIFARLIGVSPQATTAIVWFTNMNDYEVHTSEYESFLIVEGSCDFIIGEEVLSLVPGDHLAIPLHIPHKAVATSGIPCKAILQRLAA